MQICPKLNTNLFQIAPNLMQISLSSTKKVHDLHHCRKLMQIRCKKVAGTKMLKCLIGHVAHSLDNA